MKTMLIAIGLALLIATAAQAEPTQWTDHRVPIPAGKTLELGANGNLTFGVKNLKRVTVFKTTCASHAFASFRNENEHGVGEVQTISFSGCTDTLAVCAGSGVIVQQQPTFAWPTILEASPEAFHDEWRNVSVDIRCGAGTDYGVFTGTLTPKVGDFDDLEAPHDEVDDRMVLRFGSLRDPVSGYGASVNGSLLIEGRRISVLRFP